MEVRLTRWSKTWFEKLKRRWWIKFKSLVDWEGLDWNLKSQEGEWVRRWNLQDQFSTGSTYLGSTVLTLCTCLAVHRQVSLSLHPSPLVTWYFSSSFSECTSSWWVMDDQPPRLPSTSISFSPYLLKSPLHRDQQRFYLHHSKNTTATSSLSNFHRGGGSTSI